MPGKAGKKIGIAVALDCHIDGTKLRKVIPEEIRQREVALPIGEWLKAELCGRASPLENLLRCVVGRHVQLRRTVRLRDAKPTMNYGTDALTR